LSLACRFVYFLLRDRPQKRERRIVPRDRAFCQSSGKINMTRWTFPLFAEAVRRDFFHVLVSLPTTYVLTLFLAGYTVNCIVFAAIYIAIDGDCKLTSGEDVTHLGFREAFAYSLETYSTVGYGAPREPNHHRPVLLAAT
jgi:hypothetical protein